MQVYFKIIFSSFIKGKHILGKQVDRGLYGCMCKNQHYYVLRYTAANSRTQVNANIYMKMHFVIVFFIKQRFSNKKKEINKLRVLNNLFCYKDFFFFNKTSFKKYYKMKAFYRVCTLFFCV